MFQYVDDLSVPVRDERWLATVLHYGMLVNGTLSQVSRLSSATQKDLDEAAKIINGK